MEENKSLPKLLQQTLQLNSANNQPNEPAQQIVSTGPLNTSKIGEEVSKNQDKANPILLILVILLTIILLGLIGFVTYNFINPPAQSTLTVDE